MNEHGFDPGMELTVPARARFRLPPDSSELLEEVGRLALLGWTSIQALAKPRTWVRSTLAEIRAQILESLPLVLLLAGLGGVLISQQTGYQFQGNLPAWVVGSIAAASLVTEVTPLFTGIAFAAVVGTRIAAEIGAMQITGQVDALELMDRDPVAFLVVPRVIAGLVAGVVTVTFALALSMIASWGAALVTTSATSPDFWFGVRHYMRDFPLFFALIKAACFGLAIGFIACYAGLEASGGSAGVGRATRRAVVAMIGAVIFLDTALVPLLKVVRV